MLAGETYRFTIYQQPGMYMSPSLWIMGSDPDDESTMVRSRGQSLKSVIGAVNQPIAVDLVAPRTGRYGLMIRNAGSAGDVTLHRILLP